MAGSIVRSSEVNLSGVELEGGVSELSEMEQSDME